MRVTVHHTLHDLESDLRTIPTRGKAKFAATVRRNAEQGNRLGSAFARHSSGAHGKHYPRAFEAEAITALSWEYGPNAAMPQGGMSFEFGSRNQRPHLDLNRSADFMGPKFHHDIRKDLDGLFW